MITAIYFGLNEIKEENVERFKETVENEGHTRAFWGCTGRTRHQMLSINLAEKLPEYAFEIDYDTYKCIARKKEDK